MFINKIQILYTNITISLTFPIMQISQPHTPNHCTPFYFIEKFPRRKKGPLSTFTSQGNKHLRFGDYILLPSGIYCVVMRQNEKR